MARPKKATVDYFPHVTKHGQTMFILEGRYGNDGYAVFFKVLEQLGCADGHYIDCNNAGTWEFLTAYCRVQGDLLREILNLCSVIGAIDGEFWKDNFIYSGNFVEGIKDAYRQRKIVCPCRSEVSSVINSRIAEFPRVNSVINPQMKVYEMKVNDIDNLTSPDKPDDEPTLLDLVVGSRDEDKVKIPHQLIMKAYNAFCPSLPKAMELTPKRRDMIRLRYLKYIKSEPKGSIGVFDALFKKAEASDFLTGRDKKGWHGCGFDWLMNETNMVKVLEGNYDNKAVESNSDKIRSANKEAIRRFVDEPRSRF